VFGFAFNVFAFNCTFAPAASRRKGSRGHGTFGFIYVGAGWFGSSANPFFSSLYLISLHAPHRRRVANAEGPLNDTRRQNPRLDPTFERKCPSLSRSCGRKAAPRPAGNTPGNGQKVQRPHCNRFAASAIGFARIRLSVQKKALCDYA
jgi:hypothetical protein